MTATTPIVTALETVEDVLLAVARGALSAAVAGVVKIAVRKG